MLANEIRKPTFNISLCPIEDLQLLIDTISKMLKNLEKFDQKKKGRRRRKGRELGHRGI